jgi:hypothetical protein
MSSSLLHGQRLAEKKRGGLNSARHLFQSRDCRLLDWLWMLLLIVHD